MDFITLSPAILALDCSANEKIVLAYLCQQAAQTREHSSASNAELAAATATPFRSIPKLVGGLVEAGLLVTQLDKGQANKRFLEPLAAYVADYTQNAYSIGSSHTQIAYGDQEEATQNAYSAQPSPSDYAQNGKGAADPYSQNGNSSPGSASQPAADDSRYRQPGAATFLGCRRCRVTGIDISNQHLEMDYLDWKTALALAEHHPPAYMILLERFLPGEEVKQDYALRDQCRRLVKAVRAVGLSGQPIQPLIIPPRLCRVSGIDIEHQSLRKEVVTEATLKTLFVEDRGQFNQVAARFLSEAERNWARKPQCEQLLKCIEERAQQFILDSATSNTRPSAH